MSRWVQTYHCNDCGQKFTVTRKHTDPEPVCPSCAIQQASPPERISAPAIVGLKSKAVDTAYKIAEQDYGLTNMRDGQHEGDISYIAPSPEKVNPQTVNRPGFLWGGAGMPSPAAAAAAAAGPTREQILSGARMSASIAKQEGRNPMQLLHQAKPKMVATPLNKGG